MSGIVGICCVDGHPIDRTVLERMTESLAHRGPDGKGMWSHGPVGFGHRMLCATPESLHERQPMRCDDRDLCLTADARLDNRNQLKAELEANGLRCETDTDAELILRAYEMWGVECPTKLLGDFAFAVWDGRRHRLFCARDPIGVKPFYYSFDGKTFRFGSEPRPIFEDGMVPREPNLPLMCLYLLGQFDDPEETLYQGVYRLPSAHCMVLENGRLRKVHYWDIDPVRAVRYQTDAEYAEHFRALFREAVRAGLRSHGPVGAWLSGGLDSSSIVCVAQMLYQQGLIPNHGFEAFSVIFDELPCDERHYIEEVVRAWNVRANAITYEHHLSSVDFEQTQEYEDIAYQPALFSGAPVLRLAQQKGIRVMLDGFGGDELLAVGYDYLTDLLRQGRLQKLVGQLRHAAALSSQSSAALVIRYCVRPLTPRPIKGALRALLKPVRGNGIPSWVNPTAIRTTHVEERLRVGGHPTRFETRTQQRIYDALFQGWNCNVARPAEEAFTSHYGMESRHPFFDRRLVEFLLAVPEEQRWRGEWRKALLRQALHGILPEPIRTRKGRAEFSSLIELELRHRQAQKVDRLLKTSALAALGLVHADQLQRLFERYRRGAAPNGTRGALEVVVWLELWCRSVWSRPKEGEA